MPSKRYSNRSRATASTLYFDFSLVEGVSNIIIITMDIDTTAKTSRGTMKPEFCAQETHSQFQLPIQVTDLDQSPQQSHHNTRTEIAHTLLRNFHPQQYGQCMLQTYDSF